MDRAVYCSFPSRKEHDHEGTDWTDEGYCPRCEDYGFLECAYVGCVPHEDGRCARCGAVGPFRVRRERTKGWRMPPNTIYVGRPSRWSNPFRVGGHDPDPHTIARMDARTAVDYFGWAYATFQIPEWLGALRGKNLACWCPLDQPCHADVLLELANA